MTEDQDNQREVAGEVIKLIHGELPAVRWTCASCGEDACTIFYDKQDQELIECEACGTSNLVSRS